VTLGGALLKLWGDWPMKAVGPSTGLRISSNIPAEPGISSVRLAIYCSSGEGYRDMAILRHVVGETLRTVRLRQSRTLREVSASARVSLGYLSEIERGHKEPSSELLASICDALDVPMSEIFLTVSNTLRKQERVAEHAVVLTSRTGPSHIVASPSRTAIESQVHAIPTVAA
jgi:transcriptional regulator with XRE-family HTH domain